MVQGQSLRLEFSIGNCMVNFDVRESIVMSAHHVVALEKARGMDVRWLEPDEAKVSHSVLREGVAATLLP